MFSILESKSDEAAYGCHPSQATRWINKVQQLYHWNGKLAMHPSGVHHLCIVADPGHHSFKECLFSLAYSHEKDTGFFPCWQYLSPLKNLLPREANMEDNIALLAAERKLERVATFRQLLAISTQIYQFFGKDLTTFRLPDNAHVRAVSAHESRSNIEGESTNSAYIVNIVRKTQKKVLPDSLGIVPLLV